MIYTIEELKNKVCEKVYDVYKVFQEFFGEDSVDLQNLPGNITLLGAAHTTRLELPTKDISDEDIFSIRDRLTSRDLYPFILVYWPEVTVTNENNRSIKIWDLYAKVTLTMDGTIPYEYTFQLNRSKYNNAQFGCSYLHSHICEIPKGHFRDFQNPCLGNGPLNHTIETLHNENDDIQWMLFCQELALYVTVESLAGGPYIKMEYVGTYSVLSHYKNYEFQNPVRFPGMMRDWRTWMQDEPGKNSLEEFIHYYLKKGNLELSYENDKFVPGMPFFEFIIDISNCFIKWYNSYKATTRNGLSNIKGHIIHSYFIANRDICNIDRDYGDTDFDSYIGATVCIFKGREIKLERIEVADEYVHTTLMDYVIANAILQQILNTLNYRYKDASAKIRGTENPEIKSPSFNQTTKCI